VGRVTEKERGGEHEISLGKRGKPSDELRNNSLTKAEVSKGRVSKGKERKEDKENRLTGEEARRTLRSIKKKKSSNKKDLRGGGRRENFSKKETSKIEKTSRIKPLPLRNNMRILERRAGGVQNPGAPKKRTNHVSEGKPEVFSNSQRRSRAKDRLGRKRLKKKRSST